MSRGASVVGEVLAIAVMALVLRRLLMLAGAFEGEPWLVSVAFAVLFGIAWAGISAAARQLLRRRRESDDNMG